MDETTRATITAAPIENSDKDSKDSIKIRIRSLFLSGHPYTAVELNHLAGGNDARKAISDLRKEGLNIVDSKDEYGIKTYWYQENSEPEILHEAADHLPDVCPRSGEKSLYNIIKSHVK